MNALYSFLSNRYFGITEKIMGIITPLGKQKFSRLSPDLVIKEGKLGGIKAGEIGAIVGSGPLPFTAILFKENFDIKVYSVDRSVSACAVARRFLKKAFPDMDLKIVRTEGDCFNDSIDFVFLTLCAAPKNRLIDELFRKNSGNADFRVIARVPVGVHKRRFDEADIEMLKNNFNVVEVTHHENCVFKTIVVYSKTKNLEVIENTELLTNKSVQ